MDTTVTTETLLSGASLRVVLRPDTAITSYETDIHESFELKHVVIPDEDRFWGITATESSLGYQEELVAEGWNTGLPTSYAYSNFCSYVINSSWMSGVYRVYPASNYAEVSFSVRHDFELIWDSHSGRTQLETAEVKRRVAEGDRLKIAYLDRDGVWNIHPVLMPQSHLTESVFRLHTGFVGYPAMLRSIESAANLEELMQQLKTTLKTPDDVDFLVGAYEVRSSGVIIDHNKPAPEKNPMTYRKLKVFAERPMRARELSEPQ